MTIKGTEVLQAVSPRRDEFGVEKKYLAQRLCAMFRYLKASSWIPLWHKLVLSQWNFTKDKF